MVIMRVTLLSVHYYLLSLYEHYVAVDLDNGGWKVNVWCFDDSWYYFPMTSDYSPLQVLVRTSPSVKLILRIYIESRDPGRLCPTSLMSIAPRDLSETSFFIRTSDELRTTDRSTSFADVGGGGGMDNELTEKSEHTIEGASPSPDHNFVDFTHFSFFWKI